MNTKIFYLILLILTNVSCSENKDNATVLNKNLPVSISQRWDQLKKGKDQKNEKALVIEFIKSIQEKGYGIANPTYVSYDGKVSPLTDIFDDKKPALLKSVSIEVIDRKGLNHKEKLINWKPKDYKSALLFLQE